LKFFRRTEERDRAIALKTALLSNDKVVLFLSLLFWASCAWLVGCPSDLEFFFIIRKENYFVKLLQLRIKYEVRLAIDKVELNLLALFERFYLIPNCPNLTYPILAMSYTL